MRGIDEQVAKAQRAVTATRPSNAPGLSNSPVRRSRLTGIWKPKPAAGHGLKGCTINLTSQAPEFVVDAYHQLWRIEMSFRMSKHDLQARPVYHHKRQSIEAHLTIVFATLAVSHTDRAPNRLGHQKFGAPPAATAPSASRPAMMPSPTSTEAMHTDVPYVGSHATEQRRGPALVLIDKGDLQRFINL